MRRRRRKGSKVNRLYEEGFLFEGPRIVRFRVIKRLFSTNLKVDSVGLVDEHQGSKACGQHPS